MVLEAVKGMSLSILGMVLEGSSTVFCVAGWSEFGKLRCTDSPWQNDHGLTEACATDDWICIWSWQFIILDQYLIEIAHHLWLCQGVGVAQMIWCVNALVCMVLLFHSLTYIVCCRCCACMSEGWGICFYSCWPILGLTAYYLGHC